MENIQYVGEHLLIGRIGHFAIITAFFSALYSLIAYYQYMLRGDNTWLRNARIGFITHSIAIFTIIGLIFFMMSQHYYEYNYVWSHVSDDLPMKYILSAFWEGQEGSFLLWMFWNILLGFVIIYFQKHLESQVIFWIALADLIITSMLLGVFIFGSKIGSNPFALLRDTMSIPLFNNAEYLTLIKGNGLNPLLQNYWMTIHPPTLFLGFASTIIPFAIGFGSLMRKEYTQWIKDALPWALFSGSVLGTGILMGAAWAYEALSFGGYWAWDPVENMSLVPWIILIAGIHTNLIAKASQHSIKATLIFYFLSFALVIYSTFLTRSGILGDSSAHAFTQMGLEWQLVIFLTVFIVLPSIVYFNHQKHIPTKSEEEQIHTREYWMFIGSIVLFFSALLITFSTSIPVYNKLLDVVANVLNTNFADLHRSPPLDPVSHHNKFQIWIAICIGMLTAFTVFLRYLNKQDISAFIKRTSIHVLIASAFSWLLIRSINTDAWQIFLLCFSAVYAVVGNLDYLINYMRLNIKQSAVTFSHIGFAVMIIGVIFSGINKHHISSSANMRHNIMSDWTDEDLSRNVFLLKHRPIFMNGYYVTYQQDTIVDRFRNYTVLFEQTDSVGNIIDSFVVHPQIQYDNKMTKVAAANPSTIHKWNKDIFTLISSIPPSFMNAEAAQKAEDSISYSNHIIQYNDTLRTKDHIVIVDTLSLTPIIRDFESLEHDIAFGVQVHVSRTDIDSFYTQQASVVFRDDLIYRFPANFSNLGVRVALMDSVYNLLMQNIHKEHTHSFKIQQGQSIVVGPYNIHLKGIDQNPTIPKLLDQKPEIAVAAILEVTMEQKTIEVRPLYCIQNSIELSPHTFQKELKAIFQFQKIDPATGELHFVIQQFPDLSTIKLPIQFADNAPQTDYIVMEAIVFPGIQLVWIGSILMMLGLALASFQKFNQNKHT